MRTLVAIFTLIILIMAIKSTSDNAWTQKRSVNALITEKWEDWSGEARNPYKVLFAVTIEDNRSITGSVTTTYYEKGYLGALEYSKAVAGETTRVYTTSFKDLGVTPTYEQKEKDFWNKFWVFWMLIWPFFCLLMLMHWYENR